jgi:hypothetical protein
MALEILFQKVITYSDTAWNCLSSHTFVHDMAFICWKRIWVQSTWLQLKKDQNSLFFCIFQTIVTLKTILKEVKNIYSDSAWNALLFYIILCRLAFITITLLFISSLLSTEKLLLEQAIESADNASDSRSCKTFWNKKWICDRKNIQFFRVCQRGCLRNARLLYQYINASHHRILLNNRAFDVLSDYIFFFLKNYSQCNYSLKTAENQRILVLVSWGPIDCTQIIFQQINEMSWINIWHDREFQALSEYIIVFSKTNIFKEKRNFWKLFAMTVTESCSWESGDQHTFIVPKNHSKIQ